MGICADRSFRKIIASVVYHVKVFCVCQLQLRFEADNLSAAEYKAGIYRSTAADAEVGIQVNYVNQDDSSIVGSFIAYEK